MIRLSVCVCLVLLGFFAVTGCGGPKATEVKGTVTFKGEPLKEGDITFLPTGSRPAYGKIQDGQIVNVTSEGVPGAPVGMCVVTISSREGSGDMYAKVKSRIPERYSNPDKSKLTADIKPGGPELKFELVP